MRGGCEEGGRGGNNNRLCKGDKLRSKECIHEARRKKQDKLSVQVMPRR